MTKNELPYADQIFTGPLIMFINQSKGPFISERILLYLLLVSEWKDITAFREGPILMPLLEKFECIDSYPFNFLLSGFCHC